MEYKIIRHHKRRRLLVTVDITGEVTVKAPLFVTEKYIEDFVNSKQSWINKQKEYYQNKYHHRIVLTKEERDNLKKQIMPEMRAMVERYSKIMNVEPQSVKITSAEKRWGSCSSKSTICFSYKVALLSQKCKEYIVIHELSHLSQFNHSQKFYETVAKHMPDYKEAEKELDGYYIRTIQ